MNATIQSPRDRRRRGGYTLIEILLVIVIIGLLVGLLLPAISSGIRRAKEASVSAEINQLVQALADFKSRYGEYPPSRILLAEDGNYSLATSTGATYNFAKGVADITDADLARRSLRFLRKFFPRVTFSTTGPVWQSGSANYYDFNGTGTFEFGQPYVLSGQECLVWFLGGIPSLSKNATGNTVYSLSGFDRNPLNPFTNANATAASTNRQPPLFEFNAGRLVDLDGDKIPSYVDPLGTNRFYAYFSAYGNNAYDPNDDDFPTEADTNGLTPITLKYLVQFPIQGGSVTPPIAVSAAPNPYTTTLTVPATGQVTYQNPQTFQIISAGNDGEYGVGGSYQSSGDQALVLDPSFGSGSSVYGATTDGGIRNREKDNITNFRNGRLD